MARAVVEAAAPISMSAPSLADDPVAVRMLSAEEARDLDVALMAAPGFSIDQLMELAGLSVATAVHSRYPPAHFPRVAVVCGPGNNGGDGLVAARHLTHFGFRTEVFYPKPTARPLFTNLVRQLEDLAVPVHREPGDLPTAAELGDRVDVVVDAVFGFSFAGDVRAPFDAAIAAMRGAGKPVVSVDIPSGWHVEEGPADPATALQPDMLVSLSAPKRCARFFQGRFHILGGRFVPPALAERFGITSAMKLYRGADLIATITERR